jgi:hypothetical protein
MTTPRVSFDIPFAKLGTKEMPSVPLSASPRYHYDPQRRVVRVEHDPFPKLAYDQMSPRGTRRGARDQENENGERPDGEQIKQWLRGRLSPEDFAELCEMTGIEPPDDEDDYSRGAGENFDAEIDRHGLRIGQDSRPRPMTAAEERSFHERYPHFGRVRFLG